MGPIIDLRLAGLALDRGRVDEAIERLSAVLETDDLISTTRAMAIDDLSRALIARGDVEAALDGAERAVAESQHRSIIEQIDAAAALGRARLAAGDLAGAEAIIADGHAVAARASEVDHRRGLTLLLGKVRRAGGDLAGAKAAFTTLLSGAPSLGEMEARCELALVESRLGDPVGAWSRMTGTLRAAAEACSNARAATVCCHLADVAAAAGRLELATAVLGAADSLRERAGIDVRLPGTAGDDAEAVVASANGIDVEALRATGRTMSAMEVVALCEDSAPAT